MKSISLISAIAVVMLLSGCNKAADEVAAAAPETAPADDPLEITASPAILKNLKVGEPSWADVGASFTVAARIEVDESRVMRVGSPVLGRIASLSIQEGQEVKRGQLIALLNSTGLSDAQLGFLKALSQENVGKRAVERARLLLKADVIGAAELQRREAEHAQAQAELAGARDQLELLGMPKEAIDELEKTRTIHSVSRVTSSMDGTVMVRKVAPGQMVQPADTVCEIADLSHVWLVADVPEQAAGHLTVGQAVEAEIAALPNQKFPGRLSFVSATVNPETRTVRVRMDLANRHRRLKPAMLATMVLKDALEREQLVPMAAVVREANEEHVFVQRDPDTFALRRVTLGEEIGGRRVVEKGLRPGEKIVIDGAFHLNNERRRRSLRSD
jgi:cobalt-zinc-cadmium efflux system membrane fusion protein